MFDPLDHPALRLFTELLAIPAPSGREEKLAAAVRQHLDRLGYVHETDSAGNITVRIEGRKPDAPLTLYAAHLDEIGLVVTRIEPDGSLRIDRSGRLQPDKIGEQPVHVLGDRETIVGIISAGSGHTDNTPAAPQWSERRIITGLTAQQLHDAGVRPGSTAVLTPQHRGPFVLGDPDDPLIAAWTFDDRLGVATLLRLLEHLKEHDRVPAAPTLVAFTVHEEGGCHGAKVLAHREKPDTFIAIDGCPIPPGSGLTLDDRPATWSKDRIGHYSQSVVRALIQAGRDVGVDLQVAVLDAAMSDASAVYDTGGAPRVGVLGHVRENSHGYEIIRYRVLDNLHQTLTRFVDTWK